MLHRPKLLGTRDVLALGRHAPRRRRRGLVRGPVIRRQQRPGGHVRDGRLEAAARHLHVGDGHGPHAGIDRFDRQGHRVGIVHGDSPVTRARDADDAKVDETHLRYVVADLRLLPFRDSRARYRVARRLRRGVAVLLRVAGGVLGDHGRRDHGGGFRSRLGSHLRLIRVEAGELTVVHLDGYLHRGEVSVQLERRGEDGVLILRRVLDGERREGVAGGDNLPAPEVLHLEAARLLVVGSGQLRRLRVSPSVSRRHLGLRVRRLRVSVGPRRSVHHSNRVKRERSSEIVQDPHRVGHRREGLASSRG